MVFTLYMFLPVMICLFWVVYHCIAANRTDPFHLFCALFLCCGTYIFAEACHALLDKNSITDQAVTLIELIAGPSIVPLLMMYLRRLMHIPRGHPLFVVWVAIPSALFTGGMILFILRGIPSIDKAYELLTGQILDGVLALELLFLLIFWLFTLRHHRLFPGNFLSFVFKGKKISLYRLQTIVGSIPMVVMAGRVAFSTNLYGANIWVMLLSATLLSFAAFVFGLNALFGNRASITLSDYRNLLRYNYKADNKAEVIEEMLFSLLDEAEEDALVRIQEKIGENLHLEDWRNGTLDNDELSSVTSRIFNAVAESWDENSLASRFQHLMMDEELFLNPRLTMNDIAERLNTNKTYVSKMVNNTYNLGFPELINTLRVDYAEQYIISHRNAKQTEIAEQCGFLSASSFNNTFKKVTGMTPKVWISTIDRNKK